MIISLKAQRVFNKRKETIEKLRYFFIEKNTPNSKAFKTGMGKKKILQLSSKP